MHDLFITYGPMVLLGIIGVIVYSDRKASKARAEGEETGFNRAGVYYERELRRLGAPSALLQLVREVAPPTLPELPKDVVITHKSNLKGQRSV